MVHKLRARTALHRSCGCLLTLLAISAVPCRANQARLSPGVQELVRKTVECTTYKEAQPFLHQLDQLPPDERNPGLSEVVLRGAPEVSVEAAIALIYRNADSTARAIADRITSLTAERQQQIIGRLRNNQMDEPWMEIPRAILQALPQQAGPDPILRSPRYFPSDPLGKAALVLATSGRGSDARLIRSALPFVFDSSFRVWFACMKLDIMDSELVQLAQKAMVDEGVPIVVRVAAAAAISDSDDEALQFVMDCVGSFIARYGSESYELMVGKLRYGGDRDDTKTVVLLSSELPVLGVLQFMDSERAKRVLHQALRVENSQIAFIAALIMLEQSAGSLFEHDLSSLTDEDYAILCAVASAIDPSVKFPSRASEVTDKTKVFRDQIASYGAPSGVPDWLLVDM